MNIIRTHSISILICILFFCTNQIQGYSIRNIDPVEVSTENPHHLAYKKKNTKRKAKRLKRKPKNVKQKSSKKTISTTLTLIAYLLLIVGGAIIGVGIIISISIAIWVIALACLLAGIILFVISRNTTKRYSSNNNYNSSSNSNSSSKNSIKSSNCPSVQCSGTTKKGSRCRNRTSSCTGRCHLH